MNTNDKVVIVTLNFNQNDYTIECIQSILESDYYNFKILLIDNGSTEFNYNKLVELLPENKKLIVERIEDNRGYVGGINYGLEISKNLRADYIIIMNNDTIIDKSAISELFKTFNNRQKSIVTGKVYHYDDPDKLQDIGYSFLNKSMFKIKRIGLDQQDKGQFDKIEERDLIDDVFWMFPIELYNQIGGYSPYFWFNAEQADFALRAKKIGFKLIYNPKPRLWHKGSVSIGGRERNPKLVYWHIQSTLIFRYRHLKKINFFIQYFLVINSIAASFLKFLIVKSTHRKDYFVYFKAKLYGFLYFNKWFLIRNYNRGYNPFEHYRK